jgi:hypothetical protein
MRYIAGFSLSGGGWTLSYRLVLKCHMEQVSGAEGRLGPGITTKPPSFAPDLFRQSTHCLDVLKDLVNVQIQGQALLKLLAEK